MTAPAEPLRRLPVPVRPFARETIGSFLTRLAFANSLRIPHLLSLAGVAARGLTPATDDTRGWSASTPDRIAALARRPLPELAAAIPLLAAMTPAGTAPLRACGHCTAAKNIGGMVIIRARPRDYLCARHQQWLRGIRRPSLAALPEVTDSQRRHDRRTASIPDQDIARAHRQAQDITSKWLTSGWHPALTERWQHRHHRLAAAIPGLETVLADVITHPEMLAIARLLISSQHAPGIRPRDIADRLGFPYPGRPHPLDPIKHLCQLRREPTRRPPMAARSSPGLSITAATSPAKDAEMSPEPGYPDDGLRDAGLYPPASACCPPRWHQSQMPVQGAAGR